MSFRKFMYKMLEVMEADIEVTGADFHYYIEFPECLKDKPEMCQDLLDEFEREVKAIAHKMSLKLTEK